MKVAIVNQSAIERSFKEEHGSLAPEHWIRRIARQEAEGVPEPERDGYTVEAEQVWSTAELQRDFEVLGFQASFVVVIRRSDGKKGSLRFTHLPRQYYDFEEASS